MTLLAFKLYQNHAWMSFSVILGAYTFPDTYKS